MVKDNDDDDDDDDGDGDDGSHDSSNATSEDWKQRSRSALKIGTGPTASPNTRILARIADCNAACVAASLSSLRMEMGFVPSLLLLLLL